MSEDTWRISRSTDIGPDNFYMNVKLKRELEEHFARKQANNIWHGPWHPAFISLIESVKSFEGVDWSETNPTPVSLAEAGFLYDSKLINFSNILYLTLNSINILFSSCLCYRMDRSNRVSTARDVL
jgi:hypothetical protein